MVAPRKNTISSGYTDKISCNLTRQPDGRWSWACDADGHHNHDYRDAPMAAHGWWEHVRAHHGREYE